MANLLSSVSGYMGEDNDKQKCFRALRVKSIRINDISSNNGKDIYRYLYFTLYSSKKNKSKKVNDLENDKNDDNRTIFVCNVGQNDDEDYIRDIFSQFGDIEHIVISSPFNFNIWNKISSNQYSSNIYQRHALITFNKAKSANNAMILKGINCDESKNNDIDNDEEDEDNYNISQNKKAKSKKESWMQVYKSSIIPRNELKEKSEQFMKLFHEKKAELIKAKQNKLSKKSSDGFTLVSNKKRPREQLTIPNNDPIEISLGGAGRAPGSQAPRSRKKSSYTLENFYKFQLKSSKLTRLNELRQKFIEDKKRVEKQKMSRKFNP